MIELVLPGSVKAFFVDIAGTAPLGWRAAAFSALEGAWFVGIAALLAGLLLVYDVRSAIRSRTAGRMPPARAHAAGLLAVVLVPFAIGSALLLLTAELAIEFVPIDAGIWGMARNLRDLLR